MLVEPAFTEAPSFPPRLSLHVDGASCEVTQADESRYDEQRHAGQHGESNFDPLAHEWILDRPDTPRSFSWECPALDLPGSAGASWKFTTAEIGYNYWPDAGHARVHVRSTSARVEFIALGGATLMSHAIGD